MPDDGKRHQKVFGKAGTTEALEMLREKAEIERARIEFELLEGVLPARNISHTVVVHSDSPLELAIDPLPDPAASGADGSDLGVRPRC